MENRDFKYILQDITHIYLGKELTYGELWDMDEVPFKLKAINNVYFLKDADKNTKITEHLCRITKQEFSYQVYQQLKLRIKVNYPKEKKTFLGSSRVTQECDLEKFQDRYASMVQSGDAYIEELSISKLALMAMST